MVRIPDAPAAAAAAADPPAAAAAAADPPAEAVISPVKPEEKPAKAGRGAKSK